MVKACPRKERSVGEVGANIFGMMCLCQAPKSTGEILSATRRIGNEGQECPSGPVRRGGGGPCRQANGGDGCVREEWNRRRERRDER